MRIVRAMAVALVAVAAFAQQSKPANAPSDQGLVASAAAVIRTYARGVIENTFDVTSTIREFDRHGTLRKQKSTHHTMRFTRGRFREAPDTQDTDWAASMSIEGARKTLAVEMYTDIGALYPIFVFTPVQREQWIFTAIQSASSRTVEVGFQPRGTCATFTGDAKGFKLADGICGSGLLTYDLDSKQVIRIAFDGVGLPVSFGRKTLTAYHLNSNFHAVEVPGEREQFTLPANITAQFT